jgi:hypothetical protein
MPEVTIQCDTPLYIRLDKGNTGKALKALPVFLRISDSGKKAINKLKI